jgi:putative colanic acid biosynthesis acetyltransferase WcaF
VARARGASEGGKVTEAARSKDPTEPRTVDLGRFANADFSPGASRLKWAAWYAVSALCFISYLLPYSAPKRCLLRLFGARVGRGVVIKPNVRIKFPWNLEMGHHVWIGENAWIENHVAVRIGSNACISQGAFLLTGNHDYKDPAFRLTVAPITVAEGAWIGARALVTPGRTVGSHAVIAAGAVLTSDAEPYGVYRGNPAVKIRERQIRDR